MDTQPKRPNRLSLPQGGPLEKSQEFFSCSYPDCDYKSNWEENVGRHELGHNPKGLDDNIPCQVCPQTFLYLVSFLYHMASKHSNKLFCPFCLFLGEDLAEFKGHVLAHKPAAPIHRCETCAKTYTSKYSLYCHQKFYCPSKLSTKATVSAEEIQADNGSKNSVVLQQKNNCRIARLRCDKCSYRALHAQDLRRHIGIHLAGELLKCQHLGCDYTTLWTETLQKHQDCCKIRIPAPENSDGISNLIENLMKEMKIFEGESPFSCTFCCFITSKSRWHFRKHLEVHVAKAPYLLRCPKKGCNYQTKSSLFLGKHSRRVHLAPEITDIVAERSERIPMDYTVQANSQLPPPPGEMIKKIFVGGKTLFRCAICGYKSKRKAPVDRHLLVHSDQEPFACQIGGCKYRSKWSQNLKQHTRIVHGLDLPRKIKLKLKQDSRSESDGKSKDKIDGFVSSTTTAFACMLCEFIGYSELSALKHSCKHRTVVISLNRIS